jgi:hypothetical protein
MFDFVIFLQAAFGRLKAILTQAEVRSQGEEMMNAE